MKKLLQAQLKILARLVCRQISADRRRLDWFYRQDKRQRRCQLSAVLERRVRTTFKNYNNEIGLPLTIIGRESPGRSLSGCCPSMPVP
jgi:hypothetical protein